MDNLQFDVVYLMLPSVFGPDRLCLTKKTFNRGTNSILLDHVLGNSRRSMISASIHIDDVATCHVDALAPCIPEGKYILDGRGTDWPSAIPIVRKYYPELVGSVFATEDTPPRVISCRFKNNRKKQRFGMQFKTFEEQVKDTVDFYLSLPARVGDAYEDEDEGKVEDEVNISKALLESMVLMVMKV